MIDLKNEYDEMVERFYRVTKEFNEKYSKTKPHIVEMHNRLANKPMDYDEYLTHELRFATTDEKYERAAAIRDEVARHTRK